MDVKSVAASLNGTKALETRSQEKAVADSKPGNTAPKAGTSDQVTLTNVSQKLSELVDNSSAADRQAKIAEIKAAIAEGQYPINPEKIAEKLIETEQMFARLN